MKNLKLFNKWTVLLIALVFTLACNNDDEPTVGEPPVADAGSDFDAFVGRNVTLDGSNSSDPEGSSLIFNWELTASPGGSSASISDASNEVASFVPDEPGDYAATLTVEDEDGNTAEDEVFISVTVNDNEGPIEINSTVDERTTLENIYENSEDPDYRVMGNIDVNAALTIEPGVVIEFVEGASLEMSTNGSLIAIGTSENGILMTGTQKVSGYWKGIYFNDTRIPENELNYVTIEYAGESSFSSRHNTAALAIGGGLSGSQSEVAVKNTTIENSDAAGIDIRSNSSFSDFTNNSFSENSGAAVLIYAEHAGSLDNESSFSNNVETDHVEIIGGTLSSSTTWNSLMSGSSYLVSGDITVAANLEIADGADFIFSSAVGMEINEDGSLDVSGTESNRVNFSGSQDLTGYWKGIYFSDSRAGNFIDHAVISNAGESSFSSRHNAAALVIGGGLSGSVSNVSVTNTLISKSGNHGIDIRNTSSFNDFENNEFTDNEGRAIAMYAQHAGSMDSATKFIGNNGDNNNGDVPYIQGGTVSSSTSWVKFDDGSHFYIANDMTVTATLEINKGAKLVFGQDATFEIDEGILKAIGDENDKIQFVGNQDIVGYWDGIYFNNSNSNENIIENTIISNGGKGGSSRHENANIRIGGSLSGDVSIATVTNCTITKSGGYGVDIRSSSTATLTDNSYSDNTLGDVNQQ